MNYSITSIGVEMMGSDRRAGKQNAPHVKKVPRARTKSGNWRKKRSDAGSSSRKSGSESSLFGGLFSSLGGLFSSNENSKSYKTDRRVGTRAPHVNKQPRTRTKLGKWRKKRKDAK